MKKILLLILFCFPVLLFAQRYIKGRVTYDENKRFSLDTVRLIGSDNTEIKILTDSSGYYKIDSNHFSAKVNYVISAERHLQDPYCSLVSARRNIVAKGNVKIDTVIGDMYLSCQREGRLPTALFSKNSFELSDGIKDTVLDFMYFLLLGYPQLVIEIDAHTDQKEPNPRGLSFERAQAVKDYLVSKGIDSARIVAKGWGTTHLLFKQKDINEFKTSAQRDSLYQMNRRAVFQIKSWDYSKK